MLSRISVVIVALACAAWALPPGKIMQASVGFPNGVKVRFTTVSDPPTLGPEARPLGGGVQTFGERLVHRFFLDDRDHLYFGYDLEAQPVPNTQTFQVFIRPLTLTWEMLNEGSFGQRRRERPVPSTRALPGYPPVQVVDAADVILIDVLVNPKTGQKIVDEIQVSLDDKRIELTGPVASAPRDFRLDDVQLRMDHPVVVLKNGEEVARVDGRGGVAGPVLWLTRPDLGKFGFSIKPYVGRGFEKAGVIEGNRLRFTWRGDSYEVRTGGPILAGNEAWSLWVVEDTRYPRRENTGLGLAIGASDMTDVGASTAR